MYNKILQIRLYIFPFTQITKSSLYGRVDRGMGIPGLREQELMVEGIGNGGGVDWDRWLKGLGMVVEEAGKGE